MERESFKGYSEAAIVEKRALCDEISRNLSRQVSLVGREQVCVYKGKLNKTREIRKQRSNNFALTEW